MSSKDKQQPATGGHAQTGPQAAGGPTSVGNQAQGPPKTKAQLQAMKDDEQRMKQLAETRNFMLGIASRDLDMFHMAENIIWNSVNTELYRRELREQLQVSTRQAVVDWTHNAANVLLEYANINQRCHHEKLTSIYPEPEEDVVSHSSDFSQNLRSILGQGSKWA